MLPKHHYHKHGTFQEVTYFFFLFLVPYWRKSKGTLGLHYICQCRKWVFHPFLAHLSWKLKWAILIARCPPSCCPSVCLSVCLSVNFYIFEFFSRTTCPILTRLGTNHPWGKGILNCLNEGDCPSPRGDNHRRVKLHWTFLKIFFSRTSKPISIKLGIIHPSVNGILNCSNKGPGSLQRRDNL